MENALKNFCLYRHTSPIGKVYIGITSINPTARWGLNGQRYKDNTYFKNAILKYGWDNFQHEILFTNLSEEKAKHLEIALIRHYKFNVKEQRINELESYLQKTDWYAIRQADTGTPIPEEIKTNRQQARSEISALRAVLPDRNKN